MFIYLDFDGVLHSNNVLSPPIRPLELGAPGELFMHTVFLLDVLQPNPDVKNVLSISWVRMLSYDSVLKKVPEELRMMVTGAT